jgi:hypothetical protein
VAYSTRFGKRCGPIEVFDAMRPGRLAFMARCRNGRASRRSARPPSARTHRRLAERAVGVSRAGRGHGASGGGLSYVGSPARTEMMTRFSARSGSRPERVAANASAARAQRCGMRGRSCRLASTGTSFRFVRAPLASVPIHNVKQRTRSSLKLRRASKQARHSLGVGGSLLRSRDALCPRVSFLPLRLCPSAPNEGRRSAGAGHWVVRRACEARRLASRATGGRLSALHVAIFGCGTGASSSGSAHRNPRRDLAHGRA